MSPHSPVRKPSALSSPLCVTTQLCLYPVTFVLTSLCHHTALSVPHHLCPHLPVSPHSSVCILSPLSLPLCVTTQLCLYPVTFVLTSPCHHTALSVPRHLPLSPVFNSLCHHTALYPVTVLSHLPSPPRVITQLESFVCTHLHQAFLSHLPSPSRSKAPASRRARPLAARGEEGANTSFIDQWV